MASKVLLPQRRIWRARMIAAAVAAIWSESGVATPVTATWTGGGNIYWTNPKNWQGGHVPGIGLAGDSGVDDVINFTSPTTLSKLSPAIDAAVTVGVINIDAPINMSIATLDYGYGGTNTLTFQSTSGTASVNITTANGNGQHSLTGNLRIASNLNLSIVPNGVLSISGPITELNAGRGLTFDGGGTVQLSNYTPNHYSGPTVINSGTLRLACGSNTDLNAGIPGALVIGSATGGAATVHLTYSEQINDNSIVTVNSGGTLEVGSAYETIGSIAGSGTISLDKTPNVYSALVLSGSSSTIFSGTFAAQGIVYKQGPGSLTLNGSSPSFGDHPLNAVELDNGTIVLGSDNAIGSARLSIVDDTGTSTLRADGARSSPSTLEVSHLAHFAGSNSMGFASLVLKGTSNNVIATVDSDVTLASPLKGSSRGIFIKSGTGTLSLPIGEALVSSNYVGALVVNGGAVQFSGGATNTAFAEQFQRYSVSNGTLDFTNTGPNHYLWQAISGTNATVLGSFVVRNSITGSNLTLGNLTLTDAFLQSLTGTLTLGTLTLSGTSSVAAFNSLTVQAGSVFGGTSAAVFVSPNNTLTVNGVVHKPVVSSGLVNGTGSITGPITLTGGSTTANLQPGAFTGAAPSSMNTGDLIFGSNSGLIISLSGTNSTSANVDGSVDLGILSSLTLTGSANAAPMNTTYVIINNDGSDPVRGRFAGLPDMSGDTFVLHGYKADYTLAINYAYDASGDGGNNDVALTLLSSVATPEPTTATWVALGGLNLLKRRRKNRRCAPAS
jgi:fibronectin-binding autotransporter adhesin